MAFTHSKQSRVMVNERHASGQLTGWSVNHSRSYDTVATLLDDGERWIPGLLAGSMNLNGIFDTAAGSLFQQIKAGRGVDNSVLVTVMPDGFTVGKPAFFAVTDPESFEVPASVAEKVSLTVGATADDGVDLGSVLHGHQAETASGNAASVDGLAASLAGGAASLHVTDYSGLTNLSVKVQHSSDSTVWADVLTFTTATGTASERKAVSGTINRYVRSLWTVTGTGSATFVVAFARR